MKKLVLSLILSFLSTQPLFALLSPLDQSIQELKTLIESPEIRNLPTAEPIVDIWKLGSRYIISTENRQMAVDVVYSPRKTPGPQEFKLVFSQPRSFEK